MATDEERRLKAPSKPVSPTKTSRGDKAAELLDRFSVAEALSTKRHSRDFSDARAKLLSTRTRIICGLFAIATPLWIPIDLIAIPGQEFWGVALIRVVAALAFGAIALLPVNPLSLSGARIRLVGMIVIAGLFYVTSRSILGDTSASSALLTGYTYLPLILIALLGIMPLTLAEGFLLSTAVGVLVAAIEASLGRLGDLDTLGYLWLMGLLMTIALMAQVSQLHMLLQLYRQATRDSLTGLFNRRHLLERFEQEVARGHRYARDFSALLIDIDRFKRVNDTHGHLVGDSVLKSLAEVVQAKIRTTDIIGRYGGEEFLVLLPDTGPSGAVQLAERIRIACKEEEISDSQSGTFGFTVSIGVTSLAPGDDLEAIFGRADEGLYQAKGAGRDRVVEVGPKGVHHHTSTDRPDADSETLEAEDAVDEDELVAEADSLG